MHLIRACLHCMHPFDACCLVGCKAAQQGDHLYVILTCMHTLQHARPETFLGHATARISASVS